MSESVSSTSAIPPSAIVAVIRRPDLWSTAIKAGLSMAPSGWWRRRPFLPLPDQGWMHFRLETAYGGDAPGPMQAEELTTWLEWKRDAAL